MPLEHSPLASPQLMGNHKFGMASKSFP